MKTTDVRTASASTEQPLAGQVAVVTGGSSGLGLAFAWALGDAGATVVLGALPGSGVHQRVEALRSAGVRAEGVELDVSDLPGVEALRDVALEYGRLDVWVNNAGASGIYGPVHRLPLDVFDRVVDANIRGVFHGTRTAVEAMLPTGRGHVVNVWGKGATQPVAYQSAYASSKAWNHMFTRAVRAELKGTGVRVHGYDPGLVRTEMLSRVTIAPGMEKKVAALPYVVGLWGQDPADAAASLVPMIVGDKDDHRDLTPGTVVTRGLASVLRGNLRRRNRMKLDVTVLPG